MRRMHSVLLAATVALTACGSDGSTSPNTTTPAIESRLVAAAAAPTVTAATEITIPFTVTNSLPETVSGGVCATTVLARPAAGASWTNVTSQTFACTAQAIIVAPGASATFTGIADAAKVRAALGSNTGAVVFRVQHRMAGDAKSYTLQSNDVSWTLN